ncbi:hypothetical protein RIEGSTA812A_PEG_1061 [invertebrate metagenome]|uniref:Uncharacterized protein n=1 Tax=invertebrate metagenome TaxID=1711999 RepID=A0A484HBQ7_9ZZZZ
MAFQGENCVSRSIREAELHSAGFLPISYAAFSTFAPNC